MRFISKREKYRVQYTIGTPFTKIWFDSNPSMDNKPHTQLSVWWNYLYIHNGSTVIVWEWISNFTPHVIMDVIPIHDEIKVVPCYSQYISNKNHFGTLSWKYQTLLEYPFTVGNIHSLITALKQPSIIERLKHGTSPLDVDCFLKYWSDQQFLRWNYFEVWSWNIQGQGHEWGQRSMSQIVLSIQPMHFLFVSHQSD